MKKVKIYIQIVLLSLIVNKSYSQTFNGYKYLIVQSLSYSDGRTDIYGICSGIKNCFKQKGLTILSDNLGEWPSEAILNNCLVLSCYPFNNFENNGVQMSYNVKFTFKNCKNEDVYYVTGKAVNGYRSASGNYSIGLQKCLDKISLISYSFNPKATPTIFYPKVENTLETEETIKSYLKSNSLDPIEGIYKSYQSAGLPYYKIGIIKSQEKFKAIILESEINIWKEGEVKAYFEPTSMKDIYSVKWYMINKESTETFCKIENGSIITLETMNAQTKEKQQDKLIKIFPSATSSSTFSNDSTQEKATGSGFFLTKDGIIATNNHVIENANKIEIIISNEIGIFTYKAKVLLTDKKNDVALIKIDDEQFNGLSSVPYGIAEKADVGEKVYTIGYPLNSIMGNNYKVTDGIISANSGIGDDIRYFQITVALQPGNSGGPLFDSNGNIVGITSAKLNGESVGIQIENVNYAIKISYLENLYNMLPSASKLNINSSVSSKELQEQVKVFKNYVCLIKIY